MNTKLLLKTIFGLLVLLLLVVMGMNNKQDAILDMPKMPRLKQPAAIMYFGFFAVGVLTGTVITAGKKGGGSGGKSKSS